MYTSCYHILNAVLILAFSNDVSALNLQITLYKAVSYDTINGFRNNADGYRESLVNFFKNETTDYAAAKLDPNVDYRGTVSLGFGEHQRFVVNFDTSFSGLWVLSSSCYSSSICWNRNVYYSSYSQDYEPDKIDDVQQQKSLIYGEINVFSTNSEIKGRLGYDTLTVGRAEIYGQHFLEATSISLMPFISNLGDGVFGLGFPSADLKMHPPFYTMLDRGLLGRAIFGLYIGNTSESGELMFGNWNTEYFYNNSLQYHPLDFFNSTRKSWSIKVNSIQMMSVEFCDIFCQVMVDTGTALIVVPPSSLKSIYKSIGIEYDRVPAKVPCNKRTTLPHLEIKIEHQRFLLSGLEYTLKVGDGCVVGFIEGPNDSWWIFGNLFLANVYTIFDLGEMQIGFADIVSKHLPVMNEDLNQFLNNNVQKDLRKYKNQETALLEAEMMELARLVGVDVHINVLRILVRMLEENYSPKEVFDIYKESFENK